MDRIQVLFGDVRSDAALLAQWHAFWKQLVQTRAWSKTGFPSDGFPAGCDHAIFTAKGFPDLDLVREIMRMHGFKSRDGSWRALHFEAGNEWEVPMVDGRLNDEAFVKELHVKVSGTMGKGQGA